jgi:hypothetical protein
MVLLGLLALGVGAYVGSMSEQRLRDTSGLTSYAAYTVAPVYNCPEESVWLSHPGTPLPLVHYVAHNKRALDMRVDEKGPSLSDHVPSGEPLSLSLCFGQSWRSCASAI